MDKVLVSVLKRYNYTLEEEGQGFRISQKGTISPAIRNYQIMAVFAMVIGVLSFLFFSTFIGVGLFVSGVITMGKVGRMKNKGADLNNLSLEIHADTIEIESDVESFAIQAAEIESWNTFTEKDENLVMGVVEAHLHDGEKEKVMVIYSDNKGVLADDIKIIASRIERHLNR